MPPAFAEPASRRSLRAGARRPRRACLVPRRERPRSDACASSENDCGRDVQRVGVRQQVATARACRRCVGESNYALESFSALLAGVACSQRRFETFAPQPHTGIGHSLRSAALWLRLVSLVAPDRALRFAMCVPSRLTAAFSEDGHEVPSCTHRVWDPVARRNVSAVRFDMHRHLGLAGLRLRARRADFAELPRGWRPDAAPRSCAALISRLRQRMPRSLVLYGGHLRDLIGTCATAAAAAAGETQPHAALACLRHVHPIGAAASITLPPCELGLHLRSMRLDDKACDLLAQAVTATAAAAATSACAFAWRQRRCPSRSLAQVAACQQPATVPAAAPAVSAPRLFATADSPHLYATTRRLGWADLDEQASVTWNERRTIDYPAQLGDLARTAAAFVALARCTRAVIAPVVSHFSETASLAAGVPLVGCCEEVPPR